MSELEKGVLDPAGSEESKRAWWRAGVLFTLSSTLLFTLYFDIVASIVRIWMVSDTFGYGFLILPIVVFLTYRRRHLVAHLTPRPYFGALFWILSALLVQMVGSVGNLLLLEQLAFVALWQGFFVLFMGPAVLRQLFFPLLFLFFAVPMGAEVVPLLQRITAEIAVFFLRISGMPTYLSGVYIEIPSGSFVVADICSGARFLITTLVLGILATHLFLRAWWRRLLFMLLCLVVPVLANGARGYAIIMLAHFIDYRLAITVDHVVYGLIFLSAVLLTLTGLGALLRDRWLDQEIPSPSSSSSLPVDRLGHSLSTFVLGGLVLIGGKVWTLEVKSLPAITPRLEISAPQPGGGWSVAEVELAAWEPYFSGPDTVLLQNYRGEEGEVALFIAHYFYQRHGHEVVADSNSVSGRGRDKQVLRFEDTEVALEHGRQTAYEVLVQTGSGPLLIWSWYEIGGTTTISPIKAKLLEIWHTLSGGSRAATVYAVATAPVDDTYEARQRLTAFLSALEAGQGLEVSRLLTDRVGTK